MHSNWFETLQNVFRDGPEGVAMRHHLIETVRQHVHSAGKLTEAPPMPAAEEEIVPEAEPAEQRDMRSDKKRLLKKAYKLKEILSKPVALQDDKF